MVLQARASSSLMGVSGVQGTDCLKTLSQNTALLVIDVQAGFDDPAWGARNNP